MKKLHLAAALVALAWAGAASAQLSVVGSPHDLSPSGVGGVNAPAGQAQNQVCVYCHMPHNATNVGSPLWNRAAPAGPFKMYSGANSSTFVLNAADTNTAARPVGAVSLSCLSCHDGVTAFNSLNQTPMIDSDRGILASTYTFAAGATPAVNMGSVATADAAGSNNLGTDLTNDHPISFTYDTALYNLKGGAAAGGLRDPAATVTAVAATGNLVIYRAGLPASGGVDSIAAQMLFTKAGAGVANQLECASCHEPHMHGDSAIIGSNFPFLIKSNQNSNLCLTCHNK